MLTYIITSKVFDGEIELHYNHNAMLSHMVFNAHLSMEQYAYLFRHFPVNIENIEKMIAHLKNTSKTFEISKIEKQISFEDFWNKYDEKAVSSKKKAQTRWNNMSKSAQIKAYNYIYSYLINLPGGVRKKYAETYLNSEIWEK